MINSIKQVQTMELLRFKYLVFVSITMFALLTSLVSYWLILSHWSQQPPLIVVHINMHGSGLGNHMFKYAAGLGIARTYPSVCVLGLDEPFYLAHPDSAFPLHVETVNMSLRPCTWYEGTISLLSSEKFEPPYATYEPLRATMPTIVTGCMQSFKYFSDLPSPFFKLQQQDSARQWLSRRGLTSVVHVRRGDKLDYIVAPLDYYKEAMRRIGTSRVAVVTDDPDWVMRQEVFQNASISRFHDPGFDMALLAAASDSVVIGVGTFAWWGAYLSFARRKFFYALQSYGDWDTAYNEMDYIPYGVNGEWIKIE